MAARGYWLLLSRPFIIHAEECLGVLSLLLSWRFGLFNYISHTPRLIIVPLFRLTVSCHFQYTVFNSLFVGWLSLRAYSMVSLHLLVALTLKDLERLSSSEL